MPAKLGMESCTIVAVLRVPHAQLCVWGRVGVPPPTAQARVQVRTAMENHISDGQLYKDRQQAYVDDGRGVVVMVPVIPLKTILTFA